MMLLGEVSRDQQEGRTEQNTKKHNPGWDGMVDETRKMKRQARGVVTLAQVSHLDNSRDRAMRSNTG